MKGLRRKEAPRKKDTMSKKAGEMAFVEDK